MTNDRVLTRDEVADMLGVRRNSLDHLAMRNMGPPFFKVGRAVRYLKSQVDQWIADQQATRAA